MLCLKIPRLFCLVLIAQVVFAESASENSEATVSSFGFDPDDSTAAIQRALDSGTRKLIFDKQKSPWITRPLFVRSNTEVVFEEGVELVAKRGEFLGVYDSLMTLDSVTNVTVRALGKGATFRMWKSDYHKPPYKPAEWRNTLCIMSSDHVTIENLALCSSGGDGIYLGSDKLGFSNTRIVIRDCVCDDNNRQGISVITANGLLIERTVMKNTKGTLPQSGIDFEPNAYFHELSNIVMCDCVTENNAGAGYDMYLGQLNRETKPLSIMLKRCKSIGDKRSPLPLNFEPSRHNKGSPHGGYLIVQDCEFRDSASPAVMITDKPLGVMDVLFENCIFDSCPRDYSDASNVRLATSQLNYPPTDGIMFRNVTIRRAKGNDWFGRPGISLSGVDVCSVKGDVTLVEDGAIRKVPLDDAWLKTHFPKIPSGTAVNTVEFDPTKVEIVDNVPDKTVKLNRINLRGNFATLVYADKAGRIEIGATLHRINDRKLEDRILVVKDMKGRNVAELKLVIDEDKILSFNVPERGFYRITCDIGPHMFVYASSNVPLGIVPLDAEGGGVFKSKGKVYFHHRSGDRATFIGCGGGQECVTERVFDSSGKKVADWVNAGGWECVPIAEDGPAGLWTVEISAADRGYCWEDSFLNLKGVAPVFFLSDAKYWK